MKKVEILNIRSVPLTTVKSFKRFADKEGVHHAKMLELMVNLWKTIVKQK